MKDTTDKHTDGFVEWFKVNNKGNKTFSLNVFLMP